MFCARSFNEVGKTGKRRTKIGVFPEIYRTRLRNFAKSEEGKLGIASRDVGSLLSQDESQPGVGDAAGAGRSAEPFIRLPGAMPRRRRTSRARDAVDCAGALCARGELWFSSRRSFTHHCSLNWKSKDPQHRLANPTFLLARFGFSPFSSLLGE